MHALPGAQDVTEAGSLKGKVHIRLFITGTMRFVLRTILPAVLFLVTGTLHFVHPEFYTSIVPPQFGNAATLVAISGLAELAGAIGLLVPATRNAAATGLIVLLVAVWPANWYMALAANQFAGVAPAWVLWLRVPLQVLLIWWLNSARKN
jgi:uncharacterized membrane protein